MKRTACGENGLALMPLVLSLLIAGALIGTGMHVVGPTTRRMRNQTALQTLDHAARSIVDWSVAHGRLPTDTELTAGAMVREDPWHRPLVYIYAGSLADSATGGVCGRETTGLTADGSTDAALVVLSGGPDARVDTLPGASGAAAGAVTVSPLDLFRVVSLAELRNMAGCFDRTAGRLNLLTNELPGGCSGDAYAGGLFAEGGVAPYTWAAPTLPAWLTLSDAGNTYQGSGTPPSPGSYPVVVTLTDAAGAVVQRRFEIGVAACAAGPGPVAQWDFDEGAGPVVGDAAGDNDGTLMGDAAWTTDTPDGGGGALVLDGMGDHVRVGDHHSLHLTGELTLMAWVKETAVGQYAKVISRRTGYHFYFLGVDNGHPYGGIGDDVDYTVTGKSLLMSLNRWNHLAVVYNDAVDRMFLHFAGTERMTAVTRSLPPHPGIDVSIGADSQGSAHFFHGDLDDVGLYRRALTDGEIRALSRGGAHPDLVAAYGFDGTTVDSGPHGHHGTAVGATFTADRFGLPGAALHLDGNDYVRVADHTDLQLTGGLTLTAWIRERTPATYAKIISRRSGNYFYFLGVDNGRPYGGIGDGSGFTVTRKSIAMIPDQWHFIALVFDAATDRLQMYFDGTLDETVATVSLPVVPDVDLTIGADFEGTQNFFTGFIDGVSVYDRALTADQIRESY